MATWTLWGLFLAVGVGTFLIRLSFVQLHGSMRGLLGRCQLVLALLPPAILAALCIPGILYNKQSAADTPDVAQLIAALLTIMLAKYCRSVFWPIVGGMAGLWLTRWLLALL